MNQPLIPSDDLIAAVAHLTRRGLLEPGYNDRILANGQDDVLGELRDPTDNTAIVTVINELARTLNDQKRAQA